MKSYPLRVAVSVMLLMPCAEGFAQSSNGPAPVGAEGNPIEPTVAAALHTAGQPALQPPVTGPFKPLSDRLERYGVSVRGVLIDQYAGNPAGGVTQGTANVGQLNFGTDIDLEKLAGIPGGSFHTTVYRDYGASLAIGDTGTFVKQQNDYKNPYTKLHLGLVAYEQKLFNRHLDIIVGRLGTTPFYGHLVPACSFQAGATCGVPAILNSEAAFGLLPSATWGTNISYHVTRDIYLETGAFEVNPVISKSSGLDWSIEHSTGVTVPVELSWSRPSLRTERYPFELKLGAYDSTAPHADPYFNTQGRSIGSYGGTGYQDSYRRGFYAMASRVLWRPSRATSENLDGFVGFIDVLDPGEVMDKELYAGAVLTGAIRGRPHDTIGLMGTYFHVSPREIEFLHDSRVKAGGSGFNSSEQGVFEFNYGIQIRPSLRLTPNVQYIANPDNSMLPKTRTVSSNVLVFGLYLSVGFSQILGFAGAERQAD